MEGQEDIIVTDNCDLGNGMHGPWVYYRLDWEKVSRPVLWITFNELLAIGYEYMPD